MRTRQSLSDLIEGRLSSPDGRAELVKLATRLIVEEALEAESRDALGRDYYEHGAEPGRGWQLPEGWEHSLSDRMMVVLLDEMNLARVEYYFSEFLSRLEVRRGINKHDPNERRESTGTNAGDEGDSSAKEYTDEKSKPHSVGWTAMRDTWNALIEVGQHRAAADN
jgi:hypothetical protein